ncbi:MAG: hypothetical protein CMJ77_21040 [Planctomycetaceae bacterium]|nr:hypothetical protein [Planctomycetaceae bacterium]
MLRVICYNSPSTAILNPGIVPKLCERQDVMFTGAEIVAVLKEMEITHVIWVPDSEMGKWEPELDAALAQMVRVCREGEAWPLAVGLTVAGSRPLVMMQTTGLFESGDALRHVVYDLEVPVYGLIGARNWLKPEIQDSAAAYAEPLMKAWGVDFIVIDQANQAQGLKAHYSSCREAGIPGFALMAE